MSKRWLLDCSTLGRSMSPDFRAEDGSDGQLWCHQLYWRYSRWWRAWNLWASVSKWQVTKPVHVSHQELARSSCRLMRGSTLQLPLSVIDFICSWRVMKCCVKTIPETGSCASERLFTTLQWSRRWLLWPGALSLRCHHCIDTNSRCARAWILSKIYVSSNTIRCY